MDKKDGVTLINVYARGETELGRSLSNFAHTPFVINDLVFHSVEAWWYWRYLVEDDPYLRTLHGYAAKRYGKAVVDNKRLTGTGLHDGRPPTTDELLEVYRAKIDTHPAIAAALISSTLPFDHYYYYSGKQVNTQWRWTGLLWEKLRDELRGHTEGLSNG